jgi:ankyrin repeat protein
MAASLQTATAAISIGTYAFCPEFYGRFANILAVQLAWQTVQFVKEVMRAHAEARLLYQKTSNLFKLIRSVDSRLHTRQELRGSESPLPEEARIEETIKASLGVCRQCLLSIEYKIRGLASTERVNGPIEAVRSVRFTLSANTIQKQEREIETNIQALSTSLSLLQLLEHEGTQKRIDRLEQTVQRAIAHIQTIPQRTTPGQSSALGGPNAETPVAQDDYNTELLGIQSLERCIEVAQSAHSSYGSTIVPDESDAEEESDTEEDSDAEYETINDPMETDDYPLDALAWEMDEFIEHAVRDFDAENFAAAERHQEQAICHGDILEQQDYRPFTDRAQMRKRLVDIYMKQEKYVEAARVINRLLQDADKTDPVPEQILEHARLWHLFAHVRYLNFLKNKDRNRGDAERDLDIAGEYAIRKSFCRLDNLRKESFISEQDPVLLDCVKLIIRILEDQGSTVKALSWRRRWLGRQPLSPTVTNPESETTQNEAQAQEEEKAQRRISKLLNSPGRTPLINSIALNLPEEFQKMLDAGIDVGERCEDGLTPMMHAATCQHKGECGCATAIRKLKDRDADIKATAGASQETALHFAVKAGNCQTIQALLEIGADINASAPNTPLAVAVGQNCASIAKYLMEGGADAHVVDADNWTLIHHAVSNHFYEALLVLLHRSRMESLGIDLEAQSSQGKTALMHAAEKAGQPQSYDVAEALINHGANVNATDRIGRSVLFFAINGPRTADREKFAKLLLDNGACIESVQQKKVKQYPTLREYSSVLQRRDSGVSSSNRSNRSNSTGTTWSADCASTMLATETRDTKKSHKSVFSILSHTKLSC